ncbi:MAG: MazG family protein [Candidatus Nanopelagicales bacterium]
MTDPLRDLVAVMDTLRSPGGCPWDAEQTHASLVQYLLEESYETVEAIETQDAVALREELGDLLLQVVFHARIAAESEGFDIDDVARDIADKLVRRHPHVFGDAEYATGADVEAAWFAMKTREKGRTSVTDGVPLAMPGLMLAAKLRHRAAKGAVALEPADEVARAAAAAAIASVGEDEAALGALLMGLVAEADERGWDAERAARGAARDYRALLLATEAAAAPSDHTCKEP